MPYYGMDEDSEDFAPQGFNPPTPPIVADRNNAAKRFARQRLLAALAGGLSAPNQGGGFFGGLAAGFSGSIGAGMGYEQKRHEQQRLEDRDAAEQLRHEENTARWNQTFGLQQRADVRAQEDQDYENQQRAGGEVSVGATPWYEALPDTDPRKGAYRQDATRGPVGSESVGFGDWLRMPPEQRAQYGEFKNVADNASDPLAESVTDILERDPKTGFPSKTRTSRVTRSQKLAREMEALGSAEDFELEQITKDSSLEPETRRRAKARLSRIQLGGSPSQVR